MTNLKNMIFMMNFNKGEKSMMVTKGKIYEIACKEEYKRLKKCRKEIEKVIRNSAKEGKYEIDIEFYTPFVKEHKDFYINILKTKGFVVKEKYEDVVNVSWGE